jgi:hypothetical protein
MNGHPLKDIWKVKSLQENDKICSLPCLKEKGDHALNGR